MIKLSNLTFLYKIFNKNNKITATEALIQMDIIILLLSIEIIIMSVLLFPYILIFKNQLLGNIILIYCIVSIFVFPIIVILTIKDIIKPISTQESE